jgi:hypothetical protein
METTTAEKFQLPTQASAEAAPDVFVPVADTPTDPFIAHPAVEDAFKRPADLKKPMSNGTLPSWLLVYNSW